MEGDRVQYCFIGSGVVSRQNKSGCGTRVYSNVCRVNSFRAGFRWKSRSRFTFQDVIVQAGSEENKEPDEQNGFEPLDEESIKLRDQLFESLKAVIDPDLGKDIVSLGFVQNVKFIRDENANEEVYSVSFDVELTTPACPIKDSFRTQCETLALQLPFINKVQVKMTAQVAPSGPNMDGALGRVKTILAVASCKGGVGKSTTAVNLAYALSKLGARVGIMDADIYGPSLPTMAKPEQDVVEFRNGRVVPMELGDVKLMSFGYVNDQSAVMRGPMVANVLSQLLSTTDWGSLDYLVLDMPPGTGDVQLTLCQTLNIDAVVIVTTPQKLSYVDVAKGIAMFGKVNVPAIAVVQNMSYFEAPDTKKRYELFGKGHTKKLQEEFGIPLTAEMPLDPVVCTASDSGTPFMLSHENSVAAERYLDLAKMVVQEVAKVKHGENALPSVSFDSESGYILVGKDERVHPAQLRRNCRCALCIDEMTGRKVLRDEDISEDIVPLAIAPVGNYAVQVDWSDKHESLYPYEKFAKSYTARQDKLLAK